MISSSVLYPDCVPRIRWSSRALAEELRERGVRVCLETCSRRSLESSRATVTVVEHEFDLPSSPLASSARSSRSLDGWILLDRRIAEAQERGEMVVIGSLGGASPLPFGKTSCASALLVVPSPSGRKIVRAGPRCLVSTMLSSLGIETAPAPALSGSESLCGAARILLSAGGARQTLLRSMLTEETSSRFGKATLVGRNLSVVCFEVGESVVVEADADADGGTAHISRPPPPDSTIGSLLRAARAAMEAVKEEECDVAVSLGVDKLPFAVDLDVVATVCVLPLPLLIRGAAWETLDFPCTLGAVSPDGNRRQVPATSDSVAGVRVEMVGKLGGLRVLCPLSPSSVQGAARRQRSRR